MKLSHPIAIKSVALLTSWILRAWLGTMDFRFALDEPESNPRRLGRRGLYAFWHEVLLFPAYTHARRGFSILVSRHRDGELIAQVVRMLRGRSVRGSTTRGGAAAIRGMLREMRSAHLAITPDGPRGPRRVVAQGTVYLASRGGMPVVPIGLAAADCWRAPSWDMMVLPRPGRPVRCVVGKPVEVPPELDRNELETHRQRVQAAMDDVQGRAERLVAGKDRNTPLVTLRELTGELE